MKRWFSTGLLALAMLLAMQTASYATLITIDFGPLVGANQDPYLGHVEDGFAVSPTGGDWFEAQIFGNPVPSIFAGPVGEPSPSSIEVTGGAFNFSGVDLSSNVAVGSTFLIQGFFGNVLVFSQFGAIANINTFNTIASLDTLVVLDRLTILMTPGQGTTSMNLDNIVLDNAPAAVPEPSVLTLMGLGLAALTRFARRARG
ncbi:MAG TPA: PEP-CTERM sorting domain-containing protein, partial [Vicinamibacteria bacterium]|nr:PEP-CTERM sorting domain-containing protein [Vicinamibacteria bacterium]